MSQDSTKYQDEANWKKAKSRVDSSYELDINLAKGVNPINAGSHGKEKHTLTLYVYNFPEKYPGISAAYSWARCDKCDQTRWVKKMVYNNKTRTCYDKYSQKIREY